MVRGSGQTFSAGLDRAMLDPTGAGDGVETVAGLLALSDEEASAAIEEFQRGFTWLRDPRFVSVAVVQGHAIGAGFQLALSCDLRVLADDAQLCMKESALGLVPDLTGTQPLVDGRRLRARAGDLRHGQVGLGRGGDGDRAGQRGRPGRPSSTPRWPTWWPR